MDIIFPFLVLHIQKLESGVYAWDITDGGHQIYEDAGLASIEECLQQASKGLPDDVSALEIRYRSVGVGTFLVTTIHHSRQAVAQQIVSRYAEVMNVNQIDPFAVMRCMNSQATFRISPMRTPIKPVWFGSRLYAHSKRITSLG